MVMDHPAANSLFLVGQWYKLFLDGPKDERQQTTVLRSGFFFLDELVVVHMGHVERRGLVERREDLNLAK